MMENEELATLQGTGGLRARDGRAWGVQYTVTIWQEIHRHRTMTGESVTEGLRTIEGAVMGLEEADLFKLCGETLTLVLEDGKYWECILKNTNGDLVNTGKGLYGRRGQCFPPASGGVAAPIE